MPAAVRSTGGTHRPSVRQPWSPLVRLFGLVLLLTVALGLVLGGFAVTLWGMENFSGAVLEGGGLWGALFVASGLKDMALVCVAVLLLMGPGLMLLIWVAVAWWLRYYGE